MRFDFEDGSYLEMSKTGNDIYVTVAARTNDRHFIVNTADITIEQYNQIHVELFGKFELPKKQTSKKTSKKKQVESAPSEEAKSSDGGFNK